MRTYKIAAIGGDGIGPEVVEAGVQVLGVCAERDGRFTLDFQDFDWGSEYYGTHGVMMPADGADQLRKFDAILFGADGAPDPAGAGLNPPWNHPHVTWRSFSRSPTLRPDIFM